MSLVGVGPKPPVIPCWWCERTIKVYPSVLTKQDGTVELRWKGDVELHHVLPRDEGGGDCLTVPIHAGCHDRLHAERGRRAPRQDSAPRQPPHWSEAAIGRLIGL